MRELSTIYETNDKVSHAVSKFIRETASSTRSLTLRPFNRFDTANTEWWLIPSGEFSAYKFGKLCFHRYPRNTESVLYTGFYIEKGLAPELSGLPDIQKKHIMSNDWFWHTFLGQASNGLIDKTIEQVCNKARTEMRVLIEINEFNKVPEPDTERHIPSNTVEFSIFPANQNWKLIQESQGLLSRLHQVTNVSELGKQIAAIDDLRFYWIDLVIGVRLKYEDKQGWLSSDIWEKALQHWVVLLK